MIMKKETLVFLTSLAIIFIIGYVNMTMAPENVFNEEDYDEFQEEINEEANNELIDELVDEENAEVIAEEFTDYEILGDITDITDIAKVNGEQGESEDAVTASNNDLLNVSFANFKLNKEESNLDIVDHLEESLSNNLISESTKKQFEDLLINKNNFIETEQSIELMFQSKGYNETVALVDENMVKVITNDTIEQADAVKILDIIVSETNYEPSQIKIVKFDNIDL